MDILKVTSTNRHSSQAVLLGLGLICLICTTANSHAILLGTPVTGSAKFGVDPLDYFDPANGFVPAGFANFSFNSPTVTISGSQTEFGYLDGAGPVSVDFTDTRLTLTETITVNGRYAPQTFAFTDISFGPLGLSLVSNTFPGGLTSSKAGATIALAWAGGNVTTRSTYTAVYSFTAPTPVPEPGTWLVGVSILVCLAVSSAFRRRCLITSKHLQ